MYRQFYGFSEKPFNTSPDPRFFYSSALHTEALSGLWYAIEERKGFVVIMGDIGAGKTTVCRTLMSKLGKNTKVALITNTHITPRELIAEILEEFEVEPRGASKQKLLSAFNQFLINQLEADVNVVLIIDEAQNLSPKTLEEIRMLSNLETEREKLLQIILLGQPQLRAKLENPRLEQFRQRVAFSYFIQPLSKRDTEEYIRHRLKFVGCNDHRLIFTDEAIDLIYHHTHGTPRLINIFCDSALLTGYVESSKPITSRVINDVARERSLDHRPAYVESAPQEEVAAEHKRPALQLTESGDINDEALESKNIYGETA